MPPLAIYIHIPFCGQRCAYCHFDIKVLHPKTPKQPVYRQYVAAICNELTHYSKRYNDREVSSVFFGGGTPSRLPAQDLDLILTQIRQSFTLAQNAEISLEANPEDVTPEYAEALTKIGITRVSLGIQSFDDRVLKASGRPHTGAIAEAAVRAFAHMPHGVSFDLMLGLPFQDQSVINADLARVASLQPQHISVYMLERDLSTPLDKYADKVPMVDEDTQAEYYEQVCDYLNAQGYQHYEISNFAKPNYRCRHNLTYWQCGDYLGIGPAAVGRVGLELRINAPRLKDYISAVEKQHHGCIESEQWDHERFQQEQYVQGMRLAKGLAWSHLDSVRQKAMQPYIEAGLLLLENDRLHLTLRGQLLGNEVFEALIEA